jgi:hypothetical protein
LELSERLRKVDNNKSVGGKIEKQLFGERKNKSVFTHWGVVCHTGVCVSGNSERVKLLLLLHFAIIHKSADE